MEDLASAVNYIASFAGLHEFAEFTAADVGTAESGLNSVVLANDEETVLIPINEPVHGTRRRSQIHVNKRSSDELVSQSGIALDALCENNLITVGIGVPSRETSMFDKETKRVENTIFEDKNENNMACTRNEAFHTPNSVKHSSSEDWKCNSGEASISFFQASKYKRLRKHGDVLKKLPAKTLHRRFKLDEKTWGSTMNTQEDKLRHNHGEKIF